MQSEAHEGCTMCEPGHVCIRTRVLGRVGEHLGARAPEQARTGACTPETSHTPWSSLRRACNPGGARSLRRMHLGTLPWAPTRTWA